MGQKTNGSVEHQHSIYFLIRDRQYERAFTLANAAVIGGDSRAVLYLGWMREVGAGCSKDEALAVKYYTQVADMGDAHAQFYLGRLLLRLKRDDEAISRLSAAASQDYAPALYRLGIFKRSRAQDELSLRQAWQLIHKAADLGHYFAKRDVVYASIKEGPSRASKIVRSLQMIPLLWSAIRSAFVDEFDDRFLY